MECLCRRLAYCDQNANSFAILVHVAILILGYIAFYWKGRRWKVGDGVGLDVAFFVGLLIIQPTAF
jgi:hypothetical protein